MNALETRDLSVFVLAVRQGKNNSVNALFYMPIRREFGQSMELPFQVGLYFEGCFMGEYGYLRGW